MDGPERAVGRSSHPAAAAGANVLMYHSIADAPNPTSIAPAVFAEQMQALADSGCAVVPLSVVASGIGEAARPPAPMVAITFDDGFADFIGAARVLQAHGFPATVFLPTGRIGGSDDWSGAGSTPRRLMDWSDVASLARDGVEFGGHSVTHPDLTAIDLPSVEREVAGSRDDIERHLHRTPQAFAPPYGATNPAVRGVIARWFDHSVGTALGRVHHGSDRFDLPRIEMFYFRDIRRWRAYLEGRAEWYFRRRRLLRGIRERALGKGR